MHWINIAFNTERNEYRRLMADKTRKLPNLLDNKHVFSHHALQKENLSVGCTGQGMFEQYIRNFAHIFSLS